MIFVNEVCMLFQNYIIGKSNLMMSFFNRNLAGACRGRWAGPGLLAG